jgi:hypothetical protein
MGPGREAGHESSEALSVLTVYLGLAAIFDLTLWNQDDVVAGTRFGGQPSEALAEEPLRAIARGGLPDPPACGQTQSRSLASVLQGYQQEQRPVEPGPLAEHPLELAAVPEPRAGSKASTRAAAHRG